MTVIENLTPRVQYNYTAEQQQYPITFPYIERQYVKCMVGEELLVYNVDYKIPAFNQESLDDNELYLTLLITPTVGDVITIYRETPLEQQSEFPQVSKFSSQKVTEALDKLTYQQQEQQDDLSSCIRLSKNAPVGFNTTLPTPEANQVLQWNETGTQLINYDLRSEIADITDIANGAVTIANQATNIANGAVLTANQATDIANGAVLTANQATDTANGAVTIANQAALHSANAERKADTAVSVSSQARTQATSAASTANTANTKADNAVSTANTATETVATYGAAIVINRQNIERVSNRVEEVNTVATNAGSVAATAINTANSATTTAGNAVVTSDRAVSIAEGAADEVHTVVTTIDSSVQAATTAATNATNAADRATVAANRAEQAVSSKQDVLVSGTNIKTINANSILGEGNLTLDTLPSQLLTDQGKFLQTNGLSAHWQNVFPSQTGNSGKFLQTDGTSVSWGQAAYLDLSNLSKSGYTKFLYNPGTVVGGPTDEQGKNKALTYSDSIITRANSVTLVNNEGHTLTALYDDTYNIASHPVEDGDYAIFDNDASLKLIPKENFTIGNKPVTVTYTEVYITGNLIVDNNVLRGFSAGNYATLPNKFDTDQPFELVVSFITGPGASLGQAIFGNVETYYTVNKVGYNAFWGVNVYIDYGTTNKLTVVVGNGEGTQDCSNQPFWDNSVTPLAATKYKVKLIFDGTKYEYYLATAGEEYVLISSKTTTDTMVYNTSYPSYLGCWYVGHVSDLYSYFDGYIDLNESYIKINEEDWWIGDSDIQTKYWMDTSTFPVSNKYYQKPNFGIYGSPTFGTQEGSTYITNLGNNNYVYTFGKLKLPTLWTVSSSFELYLGTYYFTDWPTSGNNDWLVTNRPLSQAGGFRMRTNYNPTSQQKRFVFWLGTDNQWDIADGLAGNIDHSNDLNKYITFRLVYDSRHYSYRLESNVSESIGGSVLDMTWQTEKEIDSLDDINNPFSTVEKIIMDDLPFIIGLGSNLNHYKYFYDYMHLTVTTYDNKGSIIAYRDIPIKFVYPFGWLTDNILFSSNEVYIGDCTIESNAVTSLTNRPFNACPYKRDLIDSYKEADSWYAVYSDGWCEQGGTFTINTANSVFRIFTFPFLNNDYYLNISDGITSSLYDNAEANDAILSATKTGFTFTSRYGVTCTFKWEARGFIQLGD